MTANILKDNDYVIVELSTLDLDDIPYREQVTKAYMETLLARNPLWEQGYRIVITTPWGFVWSSDVLQDISGELKITEPTYYRPPHLTFTHPPSLGNEGASTFWPPGFQIEVDRGENAGTYEMSDTGLNWLQVDKNVVYAQVTANNPVDFSTLEQRIATLEELTASMLIELRQLDVPGVAGSGNIKRRVKATSGDKTALWYFLAIDGNESLQLPVTSPVGPNHWRLMGLTFHWDFEFAKYFKPYHTVIANNRRFTPRLDASSAELEVEPVSGISAGYSEQA